jgi:hypothetical protein
VKITRPADPPPPSGGGGRPRFAGPALERAIEKQRARYIPLTCGHHTSYEADQAYAAWRPTRDKHFCETCAHWVRREPKPKPPPPGDTPMF